MALMPPSPATPPEANNSSPAPESQTTAQPVTAPRHILDAMQGPEPSPRAEKDAASEYWTTYERIANQHDDEFIDRHNRDLDALLIFVCLSSMISSICTQPKHPLTLQAGLFSSVGSAFIVNMQSSLSPQASDTTNALLMVLINKVDNGTFSEQEASLPSWTGAGSTIIWIQSLAYTSLSMSLLAAFGGVLAKQWLGHFKTSRFGHGALRERCMRRQRKLDGLKTWHFNAIIAALPILLQLSLWFFWVALAANIWTLQHTVAGVIMGATSFGFIFYFFTVVASLKSQDCPFQTPVSTILNRVLHDARDKIMVWARLARRQSWASFLNHLRDSLRGVLEFGKDMVCRSIARFRIYILRLWSTLRLRTLRLTHDLESTGSLDELVSFEVVDLDDLESPEDVSGARSIQWIIETSTDKDIIATVVQMVPEVEWPEECDVTFVLDQLTGHTLHASFNSTWYLSPHTREHVRTCLKAIFHLYTERGLRGPWNLRNQNLFDNERHLLAMPSEQDFQLISYAMDWPIDLDIISLPFSDRTWMAHILTYHLYNGDRHPRVLAFVHDFIDKCLCDPKSPSRLVADCLLLAGLVVGLRPHRRYLAKIDKSAAIWDIQGLVIDRILNLLLGAYPVSQRGYALEARKLLWTLAYSKHSQGADNYRRSVMCLKLCFCLLEDPSTEGGPVRDIDVAAALRLSLLYSVMIEEKQVWTFLYRTGSDNALIYWGGLPDWHTQAQLDLLVDYMLRISQGTDYTTIGDVFAALAGLHGSPSIMERKHLYIQTIIRFMGSDVPLRTRRAALCAAYALRADAASMDRDDEPFRCLFSRALMSVMLAHGPSMQQQASTSVDDDPFIELSDGYWRQNRCYLGLLCALSKEPTWHGHLNRHGHFKSCLAIADTLLSQLRSSDFGNYLPMNLSYIFAIVDDLDEDHEFLRAIRTYRIWPLILEAWFGMFREPFFDNATVENWEELSSEGLVESLPSVTAYAMKYWEQWDNRAETRQLILLVKQVCDKLDEEKRRSEANVTPVDLGQENETFGHSGIPNLSKEIWELLVALRRDV